MFRASESGMRGRSYLADHVRNLGHLSWFAKSLVFIFLFTFVRGCTYSSSAMDGWQVIFQFCAGYT